MAEVTLQTCRNCRFWEPADEDEVGECRRRSPRPGDEQRPAWWPITADEDWCGEWEESKSGNS